MSVANTFLYPVVAKLAGAGLHKIDIGGARLGIADAASLRSSVAELLGPLAAIRPPAYFCSR